MRIFNSGYVIVAESLLSKSKQVVSLPLRANERKKYPSKRKTYIGRIINILHMHCFIRCSRTGPCSYCIL